MILVFLALIVVAQRRIELTDRTLTSAYDGSTIRRKNVQEFDEYFGFVGMNEASKMSRGLKRESKVTWFFHAKPKERLILEIYQNH